jgi:hypothetical protein
LRAIEAHGGLRRGLGTGTLQFGFDYRPLGQPDRRMNTLNELDVWRARAVHTERGEGANAVLGWDGRHAWFTPKPEAFPSPARFWALTPYYFVGMPFVLADPGVQFERLPDVELEGAQFTAVRVTFAPGTGGASDDYYILSLGQADARLNALRYVVSYPGFFPQGGHSPEKLMRYSEPVTVGGLIFAGRLDTYAFDPPTLAPKEKVTDIVVDGLALGAPIPGARFSPPPSAVLSGVLEGR